MSGAPKSRGMLQYVFKHFIDSFKVGKRQKVGNLMGKVRHISSRIAINKTLCRRTLTGTVTTSCRPSRSSASGGPRGGTTPEISPRTTPRRGPARSGAASTRSCRQSGSPGCGTGGQEKEEQGNHRKSIKIYCSFSPFRRAEPPTEKEVLQSLAMSQMKKINAAKVGFSWLFPCK